MTWCVSGWVQRLGVPVRHTLPITVVSITTTVLAIAQPAIAQFQEATSGPTEQSEQTTQSEQSKRIRFKLSQFDPAPDNPGPTSDIPDPHAQWLLAQFVPTQPNPVTLHRFYS